MLIKLKLFYIIVRFCDQVGVMATLYNIGWASSYFSHLHSPDHVKYCETTGTVTAVIEVVHVVEDHDSHAIVDLEQPQPSTALLFII